MDGACRSEEIFTKALLQSPRPLEEPSAAAAVELPRPATALEHRTFPQAGPRATHFDSQHAKFTKEVKQ